MSDAGAIAIVADEKTLETALKASEIASKTKEIKEVVVIDTVESKTTAIPITQYSEFLKSDGKDIPDAKLKPKEDLVVLPFSSGTTGPPKVMLHLTLSVFLFLEIVSILYFNDKQ